MNSILEPNSGYSQEEIEIAKRSLFDIADRELTDTYMRSKALKISQKSQMTKFHFRQAKKQHDDTIMTHMKDPNDNQCVVKSAQ